MDRVANPGDQGIEGNYVTYHPDYSPEDDDPLQGIRFVVSSSLGMPLLQPLISIDYSIDSSLRDLVERILPLGTYYTAILSFIENRSHLEYGLVNHALCAAIRDMLKVGDKQIYYLTQTSCSCNRTIKLYYHNSNMPSTHHHNLPFRNSGSTFTQLYILSR
jgi:gamma-tubulin complex component 2